MDELKGMMRRGKNLTHFLSLGLTILASGITVCEAYGTVAAQPVSSTLQSTPQLITGRVTDQSGEPLVGATIKLRNSNVATMTDLEGRYSIDAQKGAFLEVSYVGMIPRTVKVASSTTDIVLDADDTTLDDLVVVGYGTMKRSDVSGAVYTVDTKEMMKRNPVNIGVALQGTAPGVRVTRNSGDPSGSTTVRIRGLATLNSSASPLFVVDGVEVGTNADFVNPADIERIEVLKDASATAIYGSKGANGVIMISTKKGSAGRSNITLSANFGIATLRGKLDVCDARQYAYAIREARRGDNMALSNEIFSEANATRMRTIDWQDAMTHTAFQQNYTISGTGGNENTQAAFSVGYLDNEGIVIDSRYKKFNVMANVNHKVKGFLAMGGSVVFQHQEEVGSDNNLRNWATLTPSLDYIDPITKEYITNDYHKRPDGSWPVFWQVTEDGTEFKKSQDNPYAVKKTSDDTPSRSNKLVGNAYLNVDIVKGLSVKAIASYIYGSWDGATFSMPSFPRVIGGSKVNSFYLGQSQTNQLGLEAYATYHWSNDKNDLTAMAGYSFSNFFGHEVSAGGGDFLSDGYRDLSLSASTSDNWGSGKFSLSSRFVSYFGRLTYSFGDRYILTTTLRRDGNSNFGSDNRWATFPSFAAAWRISEEEFMKDVTAVSNLKLRAGWGRTGNAGNSTVDGVVQLSNYRTSYDWGHLGGSSADYDKEVGVAQKKQSDTSLKWETNTQTNIGIDFGMWNNALNITMDYYVRSTKDLLVNRAIRPSTGFSSVYTNYGNIENRGFEFSIGYNRRFEEWTVGGTFIGTTLKNKVKKLNAPIYAEGFYVNDGQWDEWSNHSISREGEVVGSFYGYQVEGIFRDQKELDAANAAAQEAGWAAYQSTSTSLGDYKYVDINGDGHVTAEDRIILGNGLPKFTYSLNLTASWKGFDANAFIYGSAGQKIFSYSAMKTGQLYQSNGGVNNPLKEYINNAWTESNPEGSMPRFTISDNNSNRRASSAYVKNGDYFKIGNVQIGYTLPAKIIKGLRLDNARFYFSIENLACFSSYNKYGDPEFDNPSNEWGSTVLLSGWDGGRYPSPRTYTFGLNLTF